MEKYMDNYQEYKRFTSRCKCDCKPHCGHSCLTCDSCTECECDECILIDDSKGYN